MANDLGQKVLESKVILSRDCEHSRGIVFDMVAKGLTEAGERERFIARTKLARMARFPTQGPLLTILEIDQGTYKQYETRTPLPHRFIPKFCAATGVSIDWLLTGQGKGPETLAAVPLARLGRRGLRAAGNGR